MSKHRVVVLKIITKQLTVTEAAAEYGISRRPHRANDRATPEQVYQALPKAGPADQRPTEHYRIRYDRVDGRAASRSVTPDASTTSTSEQHITELASLRSPTTPP